ncbi:anti-sigma factor [Polaribacter sp. SA4-10]|uniref:anti-sigma factor n=1 Tax=Polaribacter sp. SA4-10 TaxID=754397 RepID=UPI000B3D3B83|nr:anti-sigma factor [Polaribacter sp. SA4-10]ARV06003.1 anti-sigma factor [Polaribacter sp. SA4-10]
MEAQEYIKSGILELYVAGSLSNKENEEVYEMIKKHPEILNEIEGIENSIVTLTAALTSKDAKGFFKKIKTKLSLLDETKVISLTNRKNNWVNYSGWAASILIGSTLIWSINKNNALKNQLTGERQQMELQIEKSSNSLAEAEKLITIFRDNDIISIPLKGQTVAPEAYAKVYLDKKTKSIYLDVKGLPDPPKGKVYQVWSLKLNPLTPTSMGTLDTFITDTNKIFTFDSNDGEQAWGITLEPAGGSKTPSLDQLYTLGTIPA